MKANQNLVIFKKYTHTANQFLQYYMKPNQKLLFSAVTLYPGGENTEISFLAGVLVVGWQM